MIVYKKKLGNALVLIICLAGLGMFFIASIWGLISDRPVGDKALSLLFFVISVLGLRACWKTLPKFFSTNPELELTEKELIIYDHPEYNRIYFHDMIDCSVFRAPRNSVMIGISVKPDAPYKSNSHRFQRWYFNVSSEKSKIIFISLEFADINPEELSRLIGLRITK
jgi:hypothetical protein